MAIPEVIEFLREAGRKGGQKLLTERGKEYFRKIAQISAKKRYERKSKRGKKKSS